MAVVLALIYIHQAFILYIMHERPRYQNTHFLYTQIETEPGIVLALIILCAKLQNYST